MNTPRTTCAALLALTLTLLPSCQFSTEQKVPMNWSGKSKDHFRHSGKWGDVTTRRVEVREFSHIRMSGNADVRLHPGEAFGMEVTGNERAIESNEIYVTGDPDRGVLHIALADGLSHEMVPSVRVDITIPPIRSLDVEMDGEGDIDLIGDFNFPYALAITSHGCGDADADTLHTRALSVCLHGNGDFKAKRVECEAASFLSEAGGDVNARVSARALTLRLDGYSEADLNLDCDAVTVSANGRSSAEFKGRCGSLTKDENGKGSVDARKLRVSQITYK